MAGQDNGKKGGGPPRPLPAEASSFENPTPGLASGYVPPARKSQPSNPALPARPAAPKSPASLLPRLPAQKVTAHKTKAAAREAAEAAEAKKLAEEAAALRKQMEKTGFSNQTAQAKTQALLGNAVARDEDEQPADSGREFDGETPAPEVTSRDIWKALTPPVQSREGKRTAELYRQAIDQFAPGQNPRYEPDEDGKSRAHIFIWDLSRAMNAEVPHFVGNKELSLAQTCDWIRYEGGGRGWLKCDPVRASEAIAAGMPVLALPKELKLKAIGVVRPDGRAQDGKPLLAAAGSPRGARLTLKEALGVFAVEYYFHA